MIRLFSLLFSLCVLLGFSQNKDEVAAQALVSRIAPKYSDKVVFHQQNNTEQKDYYEIQFKENKLHITANTANSMAVGFNYYLKNYCYTSVSWLASNQIVLQKKCPFSLKLLRMMQEFRIVFS